MEALTSFKLEINNLFRGCAEQYNTKFQSKAQKIIVFLSYFREPIIN